jgi:hypothetical protein
VYTHIHSVLSEGFIIAITKVQVTIATNCIALTLCMNIRSRTSDQSFVSAYRVYSMRIDSILLEKCEV